MPERRPNTIAQRTALFEDATQVVQTAYGERLSLNEVARRIATSRRQLQRIYAEIGNTTFRDQLTEVRMERAGGLLAVDGTRTLTVREVAARVGYRQPAQFAKAFRGHHGVSPSDYRAGVRAPSAPAAQAA
jgi:transcriptional regulator GlxA family with amidase domain